MRKPPEPSEPLDSAFCRNRHLRSPHLCLTRQRERERERERERAQAFRNRGRAGPLHAQIRPDRRSSTRLAASARRSMAEESLSTRSSGRNSLPVEGPATRRTTSCAAKDKAQRVEAATITATAFLGLICSGPWVERWEIMCWSLSNAMKGDSPGFADESRRLTFSRNTTMLQKKLGSSSVELQHLPGTQPQQPRQTVQEHLSLCLVMTTWQHLHRQIGKDYQKQECLAQHLPRPSAELHQRIRQNVHKIFDAIEETRLLCDF